MYANEDQTCLAVLLALPPLSFSLFVLSLLILLSPCTRPCLPAAPLQAHLFGITLRGISLRGVALLGLRRIQLCVVCPLLLLGLLYLLGRLRRRLRLVAVSLHIYVGRTGGDTSGQRVPQL